MNSKKVNPLWVHPMVHCYQEYPANLLLIVNQHAPILGIKVLLGYGVDLCQTYRINFSERICQGVNSIKNQ